MVGGGGSVIREAREFPREFPGEFPREFPRELPRDFPREFPRDFPREFQQLYQQHGRGEGVSVKGENIIGQRCPETGTPPSGGVGKRGKNNRSEMSRNRNSSLPPDSTGRFLCCVMETPASFLREECFSGARLPLFPLTRLFLPDMVAQSRPRRSRRRPCSKTAPRVV